MSRSKSERILVLWQRFGPYHAARLQGLKQAAQARGWDAFGLQVASRDEYAWRTEGDNSTWRTLVADRRYDQIARVEMISALHEALSCIEPTCICVNGWSVTEAVEAKKWARRRKISVIMMSETHRSSSNFGKEWLKRWRIRGCQGAIVGGEWHRDYLVRLGMPADRIRLGYDVVDNDHFAKTVAMNDPRFASLGLRAGQYFFVNSRFLERKGIAELLHAFSQYRRHCLATKRTYWKMVISGSGQEEAGWKALAESLDLGNDLCWLGFLQYQELPAWYQSAGVFVHPALSEAWGLVINEACAAGLPIIAGRDVGATCELVEAGKNGWLVEPTDISRLARVLLEVTDMDSEGRNRMGLISQAKVADLGPERFGRSICELLSLPPQGTRS